MVLNTDKAIIGEHLKHPALVASAWVVDWVAKSRECETLLCLKKSGRVSKHQEAKQNVTGEYGEWKPRRAEA